MQASRYLLVADAAYVGLPRPKAVRVLPQFEKESKRKVGLLSIDPDTSKVRVLLKAPRSTPMLPHVREALADDAALRKLALDRRPR